MCRADERKLVAAVLELRALGRGEFEKPKYVRLSGCARTAATSASACAPASRSARRAIRSDASRRARPRATVPAASSSSRTCAPAAVPARRSARAARWPSAIPARSTRARRWRALLAPTRAGGKDAALLLPQRRRRRALIGELGRHAHRCDIHGVPARVLPVALWHTASTGLELWLAAIAAGASQVRCCSARRKRPVPRGAGRADGGGAGHPAGLGYRGEHFKPASRCATRDLAELGR